MIKAIASFPNFQLLGFWRGDFQLPPHSTD
jgi:hypothetical protein